MTQVVYPDSKVFGPISFTGSLTHWLWQTGFSKFYAGLSGVTTQIRFEKPNHLYQRVAFNQRSQCRYRWSEFQPVIHLLSHSSSKTNFVKFLSFWWASSSWRLLCLWKPSSQSFRREFFPVRRHQQWFVTCNAQCSGNRKGVLWNNEYKPVSH